MNSYADDMCFFYYNYFVICLLIKITLILGPQPSKHDYVLRGVSVLHVDVPRAQSEPPFAGCLARWLASRLAGRLADGGCQGMSDSLLRRS